MLALAMPSGFTREEVQAIAALANLELEPLEVELFTRQLAEILAYAEQVQQVDTSGVPPTAHVGTLHGFDRPDQVAPSLDRSEALAGAPDPGGQEFFRVPRVIAGAGWEPAACKK
jgi:aspartyl-tRNA(Asn)/glutamyl-tRNA(Gln) amidotransferase subunit C